MVVQGRSVEQWLPSSYIKGQKHIHLDLINDIIQTVKKQEGNPKT